MIPFQQGDVIFHQKKIPMKEMEELAHGIVQEGEHTGHAHRLQMFMHGGSLQEAGTMPRWQLLLDKETNIKYLNVFEPTDLTHEEHKTITLSPGQYEIGIVREYDHFLEESRQVLD